MGELDDGGMRMEGRGREGVIMHLVNSRLSFEFKIIHPCILSSDSVQIGDVIMFLNKSLY